jgi:hypothetical protein
MNSKCGFTSTVEGAIDMNESIHHPSIISISQNQHPLNVEGWNKSRAKEGPIDIQSLFLKMRNWTSNGICGVDGDAEKDDLVYTSKGIGKSLDQIQ